MLDGMLSRISAYFVYHWIVSFSQMLLLLWPTRAALTKKAKSPEILLEIRALKTAIWSGDGNRTLCFCLRYPAKPCYSWALADSHPHKSAFLRCDFDTFSTRQLDRLETYC
jgi:hypothetical protein